MEELSAKTIVVLGGFAAGILFGAVANRTNFCTMGSISDMVFMGDLGRFRAWMLSIAVAILGTQALDHFGIVQMKQAAFLTPSLGWLGAILGGLLFGFGMTMAGGCANKNLVRIGGGNLKSLVVFLVIGVVGYMTMRGLLGAFRVAVIEPTNLDLAKRGIASQGIPSLLAAFGLAEGVARGLAVVAVAGGLLVFCLKDAEFRRSPNNLAAGLILGALVPVGWWITGRLGFDEFEPISLNSFTFVRPSGDSLQYLMTFTGASLDFGIATVGGVVLGSFLVALATRTFAIEAFSDSADTVRHLVGAALMGFGGVAAMGCTVGQGMSGMSTLALGAVLALVSIVLGAVYGMRYMETGSFGEALKALLARE
ncbi:MAG: YeeE/YedE family protein [Magnetospirillum sp. WYHS-4]